MNTFFLYYLHKKVKLEVLLNLLVESHFCYKRSQALSQRGNKNKIPHDKTPDICIFQKKHQALGTKFVM